MEALGWKNETSKMKLVFREIRICFLIGDHIVVMIFNVNCDNKSENIM
jgi:uncharacterized membrane protein